MPVVLKQLFNRDLCFATTQKAFLCFPHNIESFLSNFKTWKFLLYFESNEILISMLFQEYSIKFSDISKHRIDFYVIPKTQKLFPHNFNKITYVSFTEATLCFATTQQAFLCFPHNIETFSRIFQKHGNFCVISKIQKY